LRFTKTLIGTSVAAAALGLLATAAPAMADSGPLAPLPIATSVAPGATGPMMFAFKNTGTSNINFNHQVSDAANPSTVAFTAPANTVFPDQTTVLSQYSATGAVWGGTSLTLVNCVVSNAGHTLTCTITNPNGTNTTFAPNSVRGFSPLVTVDASVPAGTVLNGGSSTINLYNYAGTPIQMLTATTNPPLLTGTPGPGAPIYNTDATVDIPGYGTPGTTITVKDANGNTIGTATVAADGTYDVKISAADAATAAAAGPVQVTESDMPGTTWPVTIDVTKLGTPIVNPLVGGGIALAAAAGLGTVLLVRRRKTTVQA
jgi:hypothetical protein